jgi:hypothetical protein
VVHGLIAGLGSIKPWLCVSVFSTWPEQAWRWPLPIQVHETPWVASRRAPRRDLLSNTRRICRTKWRTRLLNITVPKNIALRIFARRREIANAEPKRSSGMLNAAAYTTLRITVRVPWTNEIYRGHCRMRKRSLRISARKKESTSANKVARR